MDSQDSQLKARSSNQQMLGTASPPEIYGVVIMKTHSLILLLIVASGCTTQTPSLNGPIKILFDAKQEEQDRIKYQRLLDEQVGKERHNVVVREMELEIPQDIRFNNDFLWDNFGSNSVHSNFTSVTTAQWALKWKVFSQCLVREANAQKLDGGGLARCLSSIAPKVDQISAYVPYAACHVHDPQTGSNYWGITSVWEYDSVEPMEMGHIQIWLVNSSNQTVVGEASCD